MNLSEGEFLVIGDFSENYSFIIQDAVQSFHWSNLQATLHPFVCYYMDGGESKHVSFVIISDCLTHDTVAVHLFQRQLINFLESKFNKKPKKLYYFSDGCTGQYKNYKNFINLCHHEQDFAVSAEWHFFASSHGKGPCDGLGGLIKRLAARASLQRTTGNFILNPYQLYSFVVENIPNINVAYCTSLEWEEELKVLKPRFAAARTVPGTQKLHCFCPVSQSKLLVKQTSISEISHSENVIAVKTKIKLEHVNGYVTVQYDGNWWLGVVMSTDMNMHCANINFLHPHGPSSSFYFPSPQDQLTVDSSDILTLANPNTATGRVYYLSKVDSKKADKILQERNKKQL